MLASEKYTTFKICKKVSHIRFVNFRNKFKFNKQIKILIKFKIKGENEELWYYYYPNRKFGSVPDVIKYILENQESAEVKYKIINIDSHKF